MELDRIPNLIKQIKFGIQWGDLATAPEGLLRVSCVQIARNCVERVADAVTKSTSCSDDADGDKGSNQAIFDGSCAGFVFKETCEESVHLIAYPVVVHGFVEPSST